MKWPRACHCPRQTPGNCKPTVSAFPLLCTPHSTPVPLTPSVAFPAEHRVRRSVTASPTGLFPRLQTACPEAFRLQQAFSHSSPTVTAKTGIAVIIATQKRTSAPTARRMPANTVTNPDNLLVRIPQPQNKCRNAPRITAPPEAPQAAPEPGNNQSGKPPVAPANSPPPAAAPRAYTPPPTPGSSE